MAAALATALSVGLLLWLDSGGPQAASPAHAAGLAVRNLHPPTTTTSVPTPAGPFRVLMIGDSLGEDLGAQLVNQWTPGGTVTVNMAAQGDTGLVNQAYYNWPAQTAALLASGHPQLVVAMFAANDGQGMDLANGAVSFGTPAWTFAYGQRVSQIVSECTAGGAYVLWVGEPAMQNPTLNAEVQAINAIDDRVVSAMPGAIYLDPNPVLSPGGQFQPNAPAPLGDTTTRTPDGVHLTSDGAGLLAKAAAQAVAVGWHVQVP